MNALATKAASAWYLALISPHLSSPWRWEYDRLPRPGQFITPRHRFSVYRRASPLTRESIVLEVSLFCAASPECAYHSGCPLVDRSHPDRRMVLAASGLNSTTKVTVILFDIPLSRFMRVRNPEKENPR